MPRNYTRKHQSELEKLYDILFFYKSGPYCSEKRRLELLDWLWKQIHHTNLDYYGETLDTALHHLTPEQEIMRTEKQDNKDILWRYQTLVYYHSPKEAKDILMEECGLKNKDTLNRALSRARKKKREEQRRRDEEYEKRQKQELPPKKKISDDDLPF